jgi:acetoacetate decarboxylase
MEIGSAIFGVRARYDGTEGIYLLSMPMTTEQAVIGGRETYGEPKKIAQIAFRQEGDLISAAVSRMGITYLEARGRLHEALGPRELTEHAYCVKALPACDSGKGLDGEPLLVRLEWKHQHTQAHRVEGELLLRESPFDPVADLPVRRVEKMQYEERSTQSNGTVLRGIPAEWLLPVLHQRYDDPQNQGIEIADDGRG